MKIAVLDDYQGYSRRFADWGALAGGVTVFQEKIPPGDLVERLAPFDVICVIEDHTGAVLRRFTDETGPFVVAQ